MKYSFWVWHDLWNRLFNLFLSLSVIVLSSFWGLFLWVWLDTSSAFSRFYSHWSFVLLLLWPVLSFRRGVWGKRLKVEQRSFVLLIWAWGVRGQFQLLRGHSMRGYEPFEDLSHFFFNESLCVLLLEMVLILGSSLSLSDDGEGVQWVIKTLIACLLYSYRLQ